MGWIAERTVKEIIPTSPTPRAYAEPSARRKSYSWKDKVGRDRSASSWLIPRTWRWEPYHLTNRSRRHRLSFPVHAYFRVGTVCRFKKFVKHSLSLSAGVNFFLLSFSTAAVALPRGVAVLTAAPSSSSGVIGRWLCFFFCFFVFALLLLPPRPWIACTLRGRVTHDQREGQTLSTQWARGRMKKRMKRKSMTAITTAAISSVPHSGRSPEELEEGRSVEEEDCEVMY